MMISENSRDRGPYFYCLKNTIFSNAAYTLKRYVALTFLIACPKKLKKKKEKKNTIANNAIKTSTDRNVA